MFAAAVLLVVSRQHDADRDRRQREAPTAIDVPELSPSSASPTARATPVSNISVPSASPPPNSRIVPQSIWTASSHVSVNVAFAQADRQHEQQDSGRHAGDRPPPASRLDSQSLTRASSQAEQRENARAASTARRRRRTR